MRRRCTPRSPRRRSQPDSSLDHPRDHLVLDLIEVTLGCLDRLRPLACRDCTRDRAVRIARVANDLPYYLAVRPRTEQLVELPRLEQRVEDLPVHLGEGPVAARGRDRRVELSIALPELLEPHVGAEAVGEHDDMRAIVVAGPACGESRDRDLDNLTNFEELGDAPLSSVGAVELNRG